MMNLKSKKITSLILILGVSSLQAGTIRSQGTAGASQLLIPVGAQNQSRHVLQFVVINTSQASDNRHFNPRAPCSMLREKVAAKTTDQTTICHGESYRPVYILPWRNPETKTLLRLYFFSSFFSTLRRGRGGLKWRFSLARIVVTPRGTTQAAETMELSPWG